MILSSVDSYVKKVSCFGYVDKTNDGRFEIGKNPWDNVFSNQYVLMQLANGGTARVTEARTFGWMKPSSYISALYGTRGGYEFSNAQHILVEKDFDSDAEKVRLTDVSDYVNTDGMVKNKHLPDFKNRVANAQWQWDNVSEVQKEEIERLPAEYENIENGHMATHKFLIDDFCKAVFENKLPILNAWTAARFTIPGLVAIESAKHGGMPMDVPDMGDAPAEWGSGQ